MVAENKLEAFKVPTYSWEPILKPEISKKKIMVLGNKLEALRVPTYSWGPLLKPKAKSRRMKKKDPRE